MSLVYVPHRGGYGGRAANRRAKAGSDEDQTPQRRRKSRRSRPWPHEIGLGCSPSWRRAIQNPRRVSNA
jgi:hypothetical protein